MSMDLTQSIEPRSDQVNADDLIGGPITYTIREVIAGVAEPPFDFLLVETNRAYRPSKTMRRVIVNAWGAEASNYAGRRLTLYREPSIKFGGQTVGGIRISHMSHIEGPVEVMAQTTRGKREKFTVQPLESAGLPALPRHPAAGDVSGPPVAPEAAQTGAPIVPAGGLGDALKALDANQRRALYEFCGITKGMKVEDVRGLLSDKYRQLRLPDYEGEPVPITVLGAMYAEKTKHGSAEAFQRWLDTGEPTDPGDQTTLDAEALA